MATSRASVTKTITAALKTPPPAAVSAPAANDNLSARWADIVPEALRGTQRFLDVVCWNIRWFNDRDPVRVKQIAAVLHELNADLIVLEEVLDNSLAAVIALLDQAGAGHYQVAYGTTGGGQRIAFLWDITWVRHKDDIRELFGKNQILSADGKDAFPRLPLYGYFVGLVHGDDCFDFQMVGLHLKSQMGDGGSQRLRAAEALADWLRTESPKVDSGVILLGDWNQPPSAPAWQPLRDLENQGMAQFTRINDGSDISHLMYSSASDIGSRLDLVLVSSQAAANLVDNPKVAMWKPLNDLIGSKPKAAAVKKFLSEIRDTISDHLPVVTRYYFKPRRKPAAKPKPAPKPAPKTQA